MRGRRDTREDSGGSRGEPCARTYWKLNEIVGIIYFTNLK